MRRNLYQTSAPPTHTIFLTTLSTLLLLLLILTAPATAEQVTFAWSANTESNLAGYNLYYKSGSPGIPYEGTGLDQGDSHIGIPLENLNDHNNPSFTVTGLPTGESFYFTITAYNSDGNESLFSNEVAYQATAAPETFTISALPANGGTISPSGNLTIETGSDQIYTAIAAANYHIVDLLVDGVSFGAVSTYTFTALDSNHTISAVFALDTRTITASTDNNGTINPSGDIVIEYGMEQLFTFTPDEHYHIENVLVNNQAVAALTSYLFTNLTEDATISVIFAIDTFNLEAWADENGSIYPVGPIVANYNETLYFEIIPDNGMQVSDVFVDGFSVGPISEYYFNSIDAAHTIKATFVPIPEAPQTSAGPDQSVEESTETILDGSNSIDLNYEIVSYHWEQISGSQVNITAADSFKTSFITPTTNPEGEALEFCLTATNSAGKQSSDYCIINILQDNLPPSADSGYEQTVVEGVLVQLDATNSSDPDDGIVSYQWVQVAGDLVELSNPATANPTFIAPEVDSPAGVSLHFHLTVTDAGGLKACDRSIVNISWSNEPPVADAGYYQTVSGGSPVTLDGSGSYDNNNSISVYHWTQSLGVPVTLSNPTAIQPIFTAPEAGTIETRLVFMLTISDEDGLQSQAECLVEISPDTTDTTAPYLAILSPVSIDTYTIKSSSISLSGEAADNVKVEVVSWVNNLGGAGTASGTQQWSIGRIRLKKGYNKITVTATDTAGNRTDKEIVILRL